MVKIFILLLLPSVCVITAHSVSEALTQNAAGEASLTSDEIAELNIMEKEWVSSIDKAVSCVRGKDRAGADLHIRKANSVIERMKDLLIRKRYITESGDRMVAMDKLTDAYRNLSQIADYVVDAPSLIMNAGRVQAIIGDTREKLLDAYVRFYEVPPLQELCKKFVGVLDGFEREMNKVLSRV
jgi:hypothetical protein